MIKDRHIGKFMISLDLINDKPGMIRRIFRSMIVLKADLNWLANAIEYTAVSRKYFREVAPGCDAPKYYFRIGQDGKIEVTDKIGGF